MKEIRPSDERLQYMGRIDVQNPDAPVFYWAGSLVQLAFTGAQLTFIIENHVSYVFEAISRELFAAYCISGKTDFVPSRIGSYWNGSTEIDVVAVDHEHDCIFAGECKYYDKPVPADVYFDLLKKCSDVPEFRGKKIVCGIFSKSGFEQRLLDAAKDNPYLYLFDQGKRV